MVRKRERRLKETKNSITFCHFRGDPETVGTLNRFDEKPRQTVIPRSRRRRGISQVHYLQSEIPRCARNDTAPERFSTNCLASWQACRGQVVFQWSAASGPERARMKLMMPSEPGAVALSLVIPVYNEAENVRLLTERLCSALSGFVGGVEIIFVDDGSTDATLRELRSAQQSDARIRILHFARNLGQTAAMAAGFHNSHGEAVVTLDGDLQNDPQDISALLDKLRDWDVACGVRIRRQDSWLKRISSRIANGVRNWATGDDIIDTGCTLKAYRGDAVRNLELYKGMHRFLPTLLKMRGCRVLQVPVSHHPRRAGT